MTDSLPPALVLAAGLGTRLRPLTFCRAKAAVPIAGTPLIRRHLTRLAAQGVAEAVVNLHHRPETIAAAVGDGVAHGCRVRYSWEPVVLGSAGGPRHAVPLLGSRFFLINGDTLCDVDLGAMLEAHRARGAGVTLAVTTNPSPERYGGVHADTAGRVTGFASRGDPERPPLFVGVQIAEASVFETLQDGVSTASVGGLYDGLLATPGRVRIHEVTGRFHEIGTPEDYLTATWAIGAAEAHGDLFVGRRCHLDTSARIERSVLWDDVVVGANCQVTNCILTDGVSLSDGMRLDGRVVLRLAAMTDQRTEALAMTGAKQLGELLTVPIEAATA
ncbi:MAG TPA: NDP-sugar synthase [Acidobacteria bacterium]|nr:NDP-sugar synthase [Acidobacteriota bacterium]